MSSETELALAAPGGLATAEAAEPSQAEPAPSAPAADLHAAAESAAVADGNSTFATNHAAVSVTTSSAAVDSTPAEASAANPTAAPSSQDSDTPASLSSSSSSSAAAGAVTAAGEDGFIDSPAASLVASATAAPAASPSTVENGAPSDGASSSSSSAHSGSADTTAADIHLSDASHGSARSDTLATAPVEPFGDGIAGKTNAPGNMDTAETSTPVASIAESGAASAASADSAGGTQADTMQAAAPTDGNDRTDDDGSVHADNATSAVSISDSATSSAEHSEAKASSAVPNDPTKARPSTRNMGKRPASSQTQSAGTYIRVCCVPDRNNTEDRACRTGSEDGQPPKRSKLAELEDRVRRAIPEFTEVHKQPSPLDQHRSFTFIAYHNQLNACHPGR